MQVDPALLEGIGTPGQVQPPDTQGLFRHQRRRLVQLVLQVPAPVVQGLGVVQAQAFHVHHLQPHFADAGGDHRQVRQFAMGEHVAVNELASTTPDRSTIDVLGGDTVVHHQPPFPHGTEQLLAIQRQVGMPDMLEHANADNLVEATILRQVAVVEDLQVDLVGQALCLDALAAELELLLAQGDAEHLRAIFASSETRQPTPATAYVEQVVASVQAQFAAQVIELVLLRLIERVVRLTEVGARVGHVLIQPQLVERVGNVVVVGNSFSIGALVMGKPLRRRIVLASQQCFAQLIAHADGFTDIAFQLQLAFDECGAQLVHARVAQLADQLWFLDQDGDLRARPQIEMVTVPQFQPQRQMQALQCRWKLRKHERPSCPYLATTPYISNVAGSE
ncbi:hypothetical protein D9M71_427480 [compost metagenome]